MSVVLCGGALAESTGVYHSPSARLSLMLLAEPPEEALVILREPEYRTRSVGEEAVVGKERGKRAPNMSTGCLRACRADIEAWNLFEGRHARVKQTDLSSKIDQR